MTFPPMRPQIEVQRVHDMLMDALSDRHLRESIIPEDLFGPLAMAADCLCWILHHDTDVHPDSHAAEFSYIIKLLGEELAGRYEEPDPGEYIVEE